MVIAFFFTFKKNRVFYKHMYVIVFSKNSENQTDELGHSVEIPTLEVCRHMPKPFFSDCTASFGLLGTVCCHLFLLVSSIVLRTS